MVSGRAEQAGAAVTTPALPRQFDGGMPATVEAAGVTCPGQACHL